MKPSKLLTGLVLGYLAAPPAWADHLWDRRDPYSAYLFVDTRARRVGDLVTIVVQEATGIDQREDRNLDKKTNTSGIFGFKGNVASGKFSGDASADLNSQLQSARKMEGKAEFISDRKFLDRMTATVIGVMPNGNLIVDGIRKRRVTGEVRILRVRGVIRPIDIAADNTILSQNVADFQVYYEGKGQETSFSSQGWLSRWANKIWPF